MVQGPQSIDSPVHSTIRNGVDSFGKLIYIVNCNGSEWSYYKYEEAHNAARHLILPVVYFYGQKEKQDVTSIS